MRRIIVEGVDGSGKTTLIDELQREFHFLVPVVNKKGPEQDFDLWWPMQLHREFAPGYLPIHDRFYYSELVYGMVLRGHVLGSAEVHDRVLYEIRKEAFLVYCYTDEREVIRAAETNQQMDGVKDQLPMLIDVYQRMMIEESEHYDDRFFAYDYRDDRRFKKLVKRLEEYLLVE